MLTRPGSGIAGAGSSEDPGWRRFTQYDSLLMSASWGGIKAKKKQEFGKPSRHCDHDPGQKDILHEEKAHAHTSTLEYPSDKAPEMGILH